MTNKDRPLICVSVYVCEIEYLSTIEYFIKKGAVMVKILKKLFFMENHRSFFEDF